jgi:hypothetical protein
MSIPPISNNIVITIAIAITIIISASPFVLGRSSKPIVTPLQQRSWCLGCSSSSTLFALGQWWCQSWSSRCPHCAALCYLLSMWLCVLCYLLSVVRSVLFIKRLPALLIHSMEDWGLFEIGGRWSLLLLIWADLSVDFFLWTSFYFLVRPSRRMQTQNGLS